MATDTYRIMPGACGWLHESWKKDFYPEDLPAEWQLGYYGNEFPVVMLPADYWDFTDETIRDWLDDSGDNLQIVCEFSSLQQLQTNRPRLALFGDRCCGIVCKVNGTDLGPEAMEILLAADIPVCIDAGSDEDSLLAPETVAELAARHIGIVWHGSDTPPEFNHASLVLARVNSKDMEMRKLRQVIETLLNQTVPEQTVVLIFDGEPPATEIIHNAIVMLDLF